VVKVLNDGALGNTRRKAGIVESNNAFLVKSYETCIETRILEQQQYASVGRKHKALTMTVIFIRFLFAITMILFPPTMARRPRPSDEVLTRKDLAELQRRLSMMSVTAVQDFYRSAHMVCRIGPGHFPSARSRSSSRHGSR
jgi:hypothetical protein